MERGKTLDIADTLERWVDDLEGAPAGDQEPAGDRVGGQLAGVRM